MVRKIKYKEAPSHLVKMSVPFNDNASSRASVGMDKFVGEYYYIEVERLLLFKGQSRVHFDEEEILSLSQTIKEHGIRQPLTVIKSFDNEDKFEIISGERRFRAAKLAGLTKVPCIILDKHSNVEEIALIENVQRKDLHPLELARGLKRLIDQFKWGGQSEIEKKIGIPQSRVSEHLKILNLSEEIQSLAIKNNYNSLSLLLSLLKLNSDKDRENVILGKKSINLDGKNISVLRFFYKDGILRIQKGALNKISKSQKEEVKRRLLDIMSELE
ncbi:MAG: Nucleoid occlusion protein [Holosporales bacterium]